MPKEDQAAPDTLFGLEALQNLDGGNEELETDQDGEGDRPAQTGPAAGKETTGKTQQVAPGPGTDNQDEQDASKDTKDERLRGIIEENRRYKKFAPLLEVFEAEPQLAREMLARRLGFVPAQAEPVQMPQVPVGPSPEQREALREQYQRRFEEDPAGTVREILREVVREETAPTKGASAKSLIAHYKAQRIASDPMFEQYAEYFDVLAGQANPEFILQAPDQTLGAVENLALGTWAREQRGKALKARAGRPAPTRETPQSLGEGKTGKSATAPAKPRRALTPEESYLAGQYPEFADAITEDEEETTWGR